MTDGTSLLFSRALMWLGTFSGRAQDKLVAKTKESNTDNTVKYLAKIVIIQLRKENGLPLTDSTVMFGIKQRFSPSCYPINLAAYSVQTLNWKDISTYKGSNTIGSDLQGILNFFLMFYPTHSTMCHTPACISYISQSHSAHLQSTKLLKLGNHAIDVLDLATTLSLCWLSDLESLQSLLSANSVILHLLLLKLLLLRLHDVW